MADPNFSVAELPREALMDFILYVRPGEANSEKALLAAGEMENILVQDVDDLSTWPEWLIGVPTMVHTTEGNAYRGSACLQLLQKERQTPCASGRAIVGGAAWDVDDGADIPPVAEPIKDGVATAADLQSLLASRKQ